MDWKEWELLTPKDKEEYKFKFELKPQYMSYTVAKFMILSYSLVMITILTIMSYLNYLNINDIELQLLLLNIFTIIGKLSFIFMLFYFLVFMIDIVNKLYFFHNKRNWLKKTILQRREKNE